MRELPPMELVTVRLESQSFPVRPGEGAACSAPEVTVTTLGVCGAGGQPARESVAPPWGVTGTLLPFTSAP